MGDVKEFNSLIKTIKESPGKITTLIYKNQIRNHTSTTEVTFRSKPVLKYLQSHDSTLDKEFHLKSYMVTCNYNTEISYIDAWSRAREDEETIVNIIKSSNLNVHFIASTIEHVGSVPSSHNKSAVHCVKTEEEFVALVETFENSTEDIQNIDEDEYTECLVNILNELLFVSIPYKSKTKTKTFKNTKNFSDDEEDDQSISSESTSESSKRDPNIKVLLKETLNNVLDEIKLNGKYNFSYDLRVPDSEEYFGITKFGEDPRKYAKKQCKIYQKDIFLFLAHTQFSLGKTTVGYPHHHIAFCSEGSTNYIQDKELLELEIKSATGLNDVQLDKRLSSNQNFSSSLSYVLKNHSSEYVSFPLAKYSNYNTLGGENYIAQIEDCGFNDSICRLYINSLSEYREYFFNFSMDFCSFTPKTSKVLSLTRKRNSSIPCDIFIYKCKNKSTHNHIDVEGGFYKVDPEMNKGKFKIVREIQDDMEKNNLSICDGKIYQKIEDSKMSWEYFCESSDYIERFRCKVTSYKSNDPLIKDIKMWMTNPQIQKDLPNTKDYIKFRHIEINHRIVEFENFFFCTVTQAIYLKNRIFHCGKFIKNINLDNLYPKINDLLETSRWIKCCKQSSVYNEYSISNYFSILTDRIDKKNGTVITIGESNTGKSSIARPFTLFFPDYKIHKISKNTGYNMSEIKGCYSSYADEGNLLICGTDQNRPEILGYLGGETINCSVKHKDDIEIDMSKISVSLNGNKTRALDKALSNESMINRLNPIITTKISSQDAVIESYDREIAIKESPLIAIFASMCFLKQNVDSLSYIPQLPIVDNIETDSFRIRMSHPNFINREKDREELYKEKQEYVERKENYPYIPFIPSSNNILPSNTVLTREDVFRLIENTVDYDYNSRGNSFNYHNSEMYNPMRVN